MAATGDDQAVAGSAVPAVALSSGKPMPRIGLGTASLPLGDVGDRPVVREAVLRALDAGYRHFDTSAVYGTERALGDAVADAVRAGTLASRDQVYITSKLWIADAHPGHVLPALRKTLRNLQMEYMDMYLIHFPVSMRLPEAEGGKQGPVLAKENLVEMDMKGVWEEMEECHRRGLAKAIGVCNFSCKKLEYLLSFAKIPPAVNQMPRWDDEDESDVDDLLIIAGLLEGSKRNKRKKKFRRSLPGRRNVPRDISGGHNSIYLDYFADQCVYNEKHFRRKFRMSKSLFLRIVAAVESHFRRRFRMSKF